MIKVIRQHTHAIKPIPMVKYTGILVHDPMDIPPMSIKVIRTIGRRIVYVFVIPITIPDTSKSLKILPET